MRKQLSNMPGPGRAARQAGFSLLEMIVAIAIFLVVIGAMYALLEVGRSDAFNTKERTETMQNARVALNTIGRDAVNAGVGYWKSGGRVPDGTLERLLFLPAETDGDDDWLTPVVPGNGVKPIVVDGVTVNTDAVTFVYQDETFNDNHGLAVTAVNPTSNTLTVSPDNAACASGDLYVYLIDDGKEPALGSLTNLPGGNQLRFASGDPLGLNNPGASSTFQLLNSQASVKRITWVTYFVNDEGVLVRRVYGNTARIVGAGVEGDGVGGTVVSEPRVRRVEPVPVGADACELHELVLRRTALGGVLETGRVPPRALVEGTSERGLHRIELVAVSRTILEPDDGEP